MAVVVVGSEKQLCHVSMPKSSLLSASRDPLRTHSRESSLTSYSSW